MSEKIDIDELERVSSKEKSVRGRMERIVAAYQNVENKDRSHHPSYDYTGHEIENGWISINVDRNCCGSSNFECLHVPAKLVNASDDEMVAWFEKRIEQIKIRNDLDDARQKLTGNDGHEKDLLAALKNLHDPGWIHAKIVEINGLINKNNGESSTIKLEIDGMERKIDKEFDLVDKDGDPLDLIFGEEKRKSIPMFSAGIWRDICGAREK